MIAEPIRDPESIELPDEAEEILENLSPEGRKDFIREIIGALRDAKTKGDFRPVLDVVEEWYKTMLFVRSTSRAGESDLQEDVKEIVERIESGEEQGQTYDELREELDLPPPTHRRSA